MNKTETIIFIVFTIFTFCVCFLLFRINLAVDDVLIILEEVHEENSLSQNPENKFPNGN